MTPSFSTTLSTALPMAAPLVLHALLLLALTRLGAPGRLLMVRLDRPPDAADRARLRRLTLVIVACCLLGVAAGLSGNSLVRGLSPLTPLLSTTWLLVEMVGVQKSVPIGPTGRFVTPLGAVPSWRALTSWPLFALNLLLVIGSGLALARVIPTLPGEVPLHWDLSGNVNRYGHPSELWGLYGTILGLNVVMAGVAATLGRERWALAPKDPERALALQVARRRGLIRMTQWLTVTLNLLFAGVGVLAVYLAGGNLENGSLENGSLAGSQSGLASVTVVSGILLVFLPLFAFLPEQLRIHAEIVALGGSEALGTRSSGWRLGGAIYFSPEDPAVFVPKRLGIGQTLNFGRPAAWMFLLGLLGMGVGAAVLGG